MNSFHTSDTTAGSTGSSACQSGLYQYPEEHWRRLLAASRSQKQQRPRTPGETSCVSEPSGLPLGSGYDDPAPHNCEASPKCTSRRCKEQTVEEHRWWRACCKHRLVALSPDPSRTPRRWWNLRPWTPHGTCGPQQELPNHMTESRSQREGTCRPELICASSVDELWRSIWKLNEETSYGSDLTSVSEATVQQVFYHDHTENSLIIYSPTCRPRCGTIN